MSRRLHIANLFGVVALVALCVFQWRQDRRLNQELATNETIRHAQNHQLAENTKTISGLTDDLTRFKNDYSAARAEAADLQQKLRATERENEQLARSCDQLKESVTNWAAAMTLRDERLTEANARLRELATRLNEAAVKFNTLATNYNKVVDELNTARTTQAQPPFGK